MKIKKLHNKFQYFTNKDLIDQLTLNDVTKNDCKFNNCFNEYLFDYYLRLKEKSLISNQFMYLHHCIEILNCLIISKKFMNFNFENKIDNINLMRNFEQNELNDIIDELCGQYFNIN